MPPRKIPADMPYDERRKEIQFSRSALKADPVAVELLPMTETWLSDNENARATQLAADDAEMESDAARIVSNVHIDIATRKFGFSLEHAIRVATPGEKKPQQTTEFRQFFKVSPSVFVKLPFREQIARVGAWLTTGAHAVLDTVREELSFWHDRSEQALKKTDESALVRGRSQVVREEHAETLTRSRDALARALGEIADEHGLPRDWPDSFFRKQKSDPSTRSEPPPEPAQD